MNSHWPWPLLLALAVPAAIGHLYHVVLLINVGSGLGYSESTMERFRDACLAGLVLTSAFLLGKHLGDPWWNWSWPLGGYAIACVASGLVVWPIHSWRIARRQRPPGILEDVHTLDLAQAHGSAALIGGGRGSSLLRLTGNQSFQLCLREWDVSIAGLPRALEGFQILQITDLHFAPCFQRAFFEHVIAACRDWQTDLVVITGDVVDHVDSIAWIEPTLGPLEGRLGKVAILGNHDRAHCPDLISTQLERAGYEILEGRFITIHVDGTILAIGGTSAPWGPPIADRQIPDADFQLLLSHSPDLFYHAQRWGIDLMLCGHNHGGQIRLPGVGPVFMPSRYSRRFDRGFFRGDKTLMYVSEGVAGKHPVRYGCPPEICRFVLRAARTSLPHDPQTASVMKSRDVSRVASMRLTVPGKIEKR